MSILPTHSDSYNTKYDLSLIESTFSQHIDKKCWLTSDSSKTPYNPKTHSKHWGDYEQLCTFNEMRDFLHSSPEHRPCLIPAAADLIALDIDKVKGEIDPIPSEILELIERINSYTELSQSGTGMHIILPGKSPGTSSIGKVYSKKIEFLTHHPVTLTGKFIEPFVTLQSNEVALSQLYAEVFPPKEKKEPKTCPFSPPMEDDEIISLCRSSTRHERFETLFDHGELSHDQGDHSLADFVLCSIFGFYTQDPEQVFRLFQRSALCREKERQDKWERESYRIPTIQKAIEGCNQYYQPKKLIPVQQVNCSWDNPFPIHIDEYFNAPFPLHALPDVLRQAIEETARFAQTDCALPFIPAQGQLSLQIGRKIVIEEKPGLAHHPSLFLVGAAATGERKSSIDEAISGQLKDQIEQEIPDREIHNKTVKIQNDLIEDQITAIKKQLREGKIPKEEASQLVIELSNTKGTVLPELVNFCDDITPARLFQKLHLHRGAYGIFSSDGRKIFNRLIGRGDRESVTGEDIYVSGVWGDTIYRSRVSGGAEGEGEDLFIRKPALTVSVFIQPDLWEDFLRNKTMRDSGLISRICAVNPPSKMGYRLETEHDHPLNYAQISPYVNAIIRIRKWQPERPLVIRLSPEAAKERRDYYNAIEHELRPGGEFEEVRDIATRNISITTRIAGSWHLFAIAGEGRIPLDHSPTEISREQWLKAQECGEYFLAQGIEMQKAYAPSGKNHLLEKVALWLIKLVEDHTKEEPLFTLKSTLINRNRNTEESIDEIISALESAGWLRKAHRTRKDDSHYYEVNLKIRHFSKKGNDHDYTNTQIHYKRYF